MLLDPYLTCGILTYECLFKQWILTINKIVQRICASERNSKYYPPPPHTIHFFRKYLLNAVEILQKKMSFDDISKNKE